MQLGLKLNDGPPLVKRALSVLIPLILLVLAFLLSSRLESSLPNSFILFFLAAAGVSGWFGRKWFGLLAALLSVSGVHYFLTRNTAFVPGRREAAFLLLFAVCAFSASWLAARRRLIEIELAASEERSRLLLGSVKDYAIFLLDLEGRVASWNVSAQRISGYAASDIIGRHFSLFYLPDDIERRHPETELQIARRDGRYEEEGLRTRKDGSRYWASVVITPLFDGLGRLRGYSKVVRDITDRKTTEFRLEQSRLELRAVIEAAPDAVLMVDHNGIITFANAQVERLFGYPRAELLGSAVEVLIPSRVRAGHRENRSGYWKSPHARPMGQQIELYALRKDASEFPVEISLSPIDTAEGRRVIAVVRDITDRKRTEQALQQTRILDLAQVLIRGLDGRIAYWNLGAERLYGIPREEALGKISHDLLATKFPAPIAQIEQELLAVGQWEGELEHRTRGGERIIVRSHWALYRDEHGRPAQILEVNTDITERVYAEQMLEAMNRRLEERNADMQNAKLTIEAQTQQIAASAKMSALGEMAGGIAHEINNPMGIIHARASDLGEIAGESDSIPSSVVREATEKICQMAMRVSTITKGLRKFARDARSDPFHSSLVREIIEDTLALCQVRLRRNAIDLRVHAYDSSLRIECRATEIAQVLLNLLNNALDALQPLSDKWISLRVHDRSEDVEISVTDSGAGIPAALHDKILQPFFTTKEVGMGTGLGLSISRGIVEAHHGSLSLDDGSKNTCFVIRLPKRQPVQEPSLIVSKPSA